jgi:hypothetical protein
MIKRRGWTNKEQRRLKELLLSGLTPAKAAKRLGRPRSSAWACAISHGWHVRAQGKPSETKKHSLVLITKAAVPVWYAAGWRFDGFSGPGFCRMSWHSERAPVIPSIDELVIDNVREAA